MTVYGSVLTITGDVAETTRWEGWPLPMTVTVFPRSGTGTHAAKAQFYATFLAQLAVGPPQTLASKWLGQSGIEHEVVTEQQPGESVMDFVKRHTAVVDAPKAVDPPKKAGP